MLKSCEDPRLSLVRLDHRFDRCIDVLRCRAELPCRYQLLVVVGDPGRLLFRPGLSHRLPDGGQVNHFAGQLLSIIGSVAHMDAAIGAETQQAPSDNIVLFEKLSDASQYLDCPKTNQVEELTRISRRCCSLKESFGAGTSVLKER